MKRKRSQKEIEQRIESDSYIDVWDRNGRKIIEDGEAVEEPTKNAHRGPISRPEGPG